METDREQEQEQEKYSFIQESIKDEKIDLKKSLQKVCKMLGLGAVFGCAACLSFFLMRPWAEKLFPKETNEVEVNEVDVSEKEDEPDNGAEDAQESVQENLIVENYKELNEALRLVAKETERCIAYVNGIGQDESWGDIQGQESSASYQTSGVIVADNGREILILANYSSMKNAHFFRVTFVDGSEHEAVIKQKDGSTDMAVFSVAKTGISEGTANKIRIAAMGNSNILKQGDGVIAIGKPFGCEDGLGYGIASTLNQAVVRADGKYNIIITDMPGTQKASGGIFDFKGNLVGMIDSTLLEEEQIQTLAFVGISSISKEVELMSNGKSVPYVGVIGVTITIEMSERYGIPLGLFVESVEVDSPAMKAGIQRGDVITWTAGEEIDSLIGYYGVIIQQEPGKAIRIEGQRQGAGGYVDIKFDVTVGIKE